MSGFSSQFDDRIEAAEVKASEAHFALNVAAQQTTEWNKHTNEFKNTIQPVHRGWQNQITEVRTRPVSLVNLNQQLNTLSKYRYPMWRNPTFLRYRLGNLLRRLHVNVLRVWVVVRDIILWIIDHIVLILVTAGIIVIFALIAMNWDAIVDAFNDLLNSIP